MISLIVAVFGPSTVVKSRAICETSLRTSASNCGSDAIICVELKIGITGADDGVESSWNDVSMSEASMYICIVDGVDDLLPRCNLELERIG